MPERPKSIETHQTTNHGSFVWTVSAFLVSFLAAGSQLWYGSYIEYLEQGNPLRFWGTTAVIAIAMTLVSGLGVCRCALAVGFGVPAAVIFRIIGDVARDPTSHNLLPFEIALALVIGMAVAWSGAGIGGLVRYLIRRWRKSGPCSS